MLCLLGLVVAGGVAYLASELVREDIGLASLPLRDTRALDPRSDGEDRGTSTTSTTSSGTGSTSSTTSTQTDMTSTSDDDTGDDDSGGDDDESGSDDSGSDDD